MKLAGLVVGCVLGLVSTRPAAAEQPSAPPGGPFPPLPGGPFPPPSLQTTPPALTAENKPAPVASTRSKGTGLLIGGLITLVHGLPVMIAGAILSAGCPSGTGGGGGGYISGGGSHGNYSLGSFDMSCAVKPIGNILLGVGGGISTIALGLLVGSAAQRSSAPAPTTSAIPTIAVGIGHASARWSF